MTRKLLEPVHARTEAGDDVRQGKDEFFGPWFSTRTAARYLDKPTVAAFRKWAYRHGIQFRFCGRRLLVAKRDLDLAIGETVLRRKVS
jgi:enoyl-CoA hydratase/carnithine racemase